MSGVAKVHITFAGDEKDATFYFKDFVETDQEIKFGGALLSEYGSFNYYDEYRITKRHMQSMKVTDNATVSEFTKKKYPMVGEYFSDVDHIGDVSI